MSAMADIPTIGIGPKYSALLPYYIWRPPTYAGESARARFRLCALGPPKRGRRVGIRSVSKRISLSDDKIKNPPKCGVQWWAL